MNSISKTDSIRISNYTDCVCQLQITEIGLSGAALNVTGFHPNAEAAHASLKQLLNEKKSHNHIGITLCLFATATPRVESTTIFRLFYPNQHTRTQCRLGTTKGTRFKCRIANVFRVCWKKSVYTRMETASTEI